MAEGPDVATGNARRLDWHVLLPRRQSDTPGHWLLLGGGLDLPRLAVDLGLAGSATTEESVDGPADVVALLHGSREPLGRAVDALAPGGILYWEIDRRSIRRSVVTPGRALSRIRAAGLIPLTVYWVGPGWSRPSRFLPVDPPGPIAWYLSTSNADRSPVRGALRRLAGRLVRWPRIASLLVPRFAVVATSGRRPTLCIPAALGHPDVPASVRTSSIPPILVAAGVEPWGRMTLLAFDEEGSAPAVVVKIGRHAEFDEANRHEHEVLVDLRDRLDTATRSTVPDPIALIDVGGRPAIVQGAARGSSALARMPGRHHGHGPWMDLDLTAEWLISLGRQTSRSPAAPGSPGWSRHVDEPLARFARAFGPRAEVDRLFGRLRDYTTAVGAELAVVLCHRDLGPWNVLVDGNTVRVIDWEVARDGPAVTDLVYASLHWSFAHDGRASEPARRYQLRRLLTESLEDDPGQSAIRGAIHRYSEALQVDLRLVPALVVLTVVEQALDRFDRLQQLAMRDRDPWAQNRYAGYVAEIATFDPDWLTNPMRFMGPR